jgi:uncharacterized protein
VTITTAALVAGVVAALVVGLSKTALPGAGLLAGPILATAPHGRLLPGVTLPILLTADVFAVTWFRRHARWDLLRSLLPGVALGFAAGAAFFVAVGKSARALDITIGLTILSMVVVQLWRTVRRSPPAPATFGAATGYGAAGGFTTFVANAAGPVMNTYLLGLGLDKDALVGTAAWFYFAVNLAKIPFYLAVGELSDGGRFFTGASLRFDLILVPAVVIGVLVGRRLFYLLPQRVFSHLVLVLSAVGALKLLLVP